MQKKVEVLAPVGSLESLDAAIRHGADAVYLGVGRLNARGDSAQLAASGLPEIVRRCHAALMRVYLTLNILLRDDELDDAMELARTAFELGIDALIVQDRGLMRRLHDELPEMTLHISTQATINAPEALDEMAELGATRVVLMREYTLDDMRRFCGAAHALGIECEAFVHGALCISISGQCHMSRFMGGRSANRGDCAQCCRLNYRLLRDGKATGVTGALLSARDLGYYRGLNALLETGVDSLKIEGRLRQPAYVAAATRAYREAVTNILGGETNVTTNDRLTERKLLASFNRGGAFNLAPLRNERDANFVSPVRTGHYGLPIGTVHSVRAQAGELIIALSVPNDRADAATLETVGAGLHRGTTLSIRDENKNEIATAPCGVLTLEPNSRLRVKGFHPRVLRLVRPGFSVLQMDTTVPDTPFPRQKIDAHLTLSERDDIVSLHGSFRHPFNDALIIERTVSENDLSDNPLPGGENNPPKARPLPETRIREQLAKFGDSPFALAGLTIETNPARPVSRINALRRALLASLENALVTPVRAPVRSEPAEKIAHDDRPDQDAPRLERIMFLPAFRPDQDGIQSLADARKIHQPDAIGLPFEALTRWIETDADSGASVRSLCDDVRVFAVMPVYFPLAERDELIERLIRLKRAGLFGVASGAGGMRGLIRDIPELRSLRSFFSLGSQVMNAVSFRQALSQGHDYVLITPELDEPQRDALLDQLTAEEKTHAVIWKEGRTRAMTIRYCPIGHNQGKNGCRKCLEGDYALEDEKGRVFPLIPRRDLDCTVDIMQSEIHEMSSVDGVTGFLSIL